MRIYKYLTRREILSVAANGLVPYMPQGEEYKILEEYARKHNLVYKIGKHTEIALTVRAIYGSLNTAAINLSVKAYRHPGGIISFFHVSHLKRLPIFVANYTYKTRLREAISIKNTNGILKYTELYWKSVKNLFDFVNYDMPKIREEIFRKSKTTTTANFMVRKKIGEYEVLTYVPIKPWYIYVKLRHKSYEPFMNWMYRHRGLFKIVATEVNTKSEREKIKEEYNKFLENYKLWKKKYETTKIRFAVSEEKS